MKKHFLLAALALLPPVASAYDQGSIMARWKPIVTFAGNGQPAVAIDHLRGINEIQSLMLDHTRFDTGSQRFIEDLWSSIGDFNLARFYSILPEQEGEWRSLRVQGIRQGPYYCYIDASKMTPALITPVDSLGQSSLMVRARKMHFVDTGKTHYLLNADWQIGWGAYSWQSFRETVNESLRILSLPEPTIAAGNASERERIHTQIRQMSGRLGDEDIAVLAPLWAAFPHLWQRFSQIGKVENVLVDKHSSIYGIDPRGQGLKDVDIVISLAPDAFARHYPALAAYIQRIDDLLHADLALSNADGRLINISLDTTKLTLRVSMVVNGSGLVPIANDRARVEKTVYFADQDIRLTAVVNAQVDLLGITTDINELRSTLTYQPRGEEARIDFHMNTLPVVGVKGAALGFIPTGVIDAMLPADMHGIVTEFMKVAVEGNDGQGISAYLTLHNTRNPGVTQLSMGGSVEALDSLLARMGVAIVNQRLIPSDDQGKELIALAKSSRQAFDQDLENYEKMVDAQLALRSDDINTP